MFSNAIDSHAAMIAEIAFLREYSRGVAEERDRLLRGCKIAYLELTARRPVLMTREQVVTSVRASIPNVATGGTP